MRKKKNNYFTYEDIQEPKRFLLYKKRPNLHQIFQYLVIMNLNHLQSSIPSPKKNIRDLNRKKKGKNSPNINFLLNEKQKTFLQQNYFLREQVQFFQQKHDSPYSF